MNIKEHIEAGHYERDAKGRSLVPYARGGTVVICATDMPGPCPLLGFRIDGNGNREEHTTADSGWGYRDDSHYLLPPPPRKVKVTRWGVYSMGGTFIQTYEDKHEAQHACRSGVPAYRLVELTGEYEEPWS